MFHGIYYQIILYKTFLESIYFCVENIFKIRLIKNSEPFELVSMGNLNVFLIYIFIFVAYNVISIVFIELNESLY